MPRDTAYLIVYDVTDDRERDGVAEIIEGFGLRVQKSVFECRLTRSAKERLVSRLENLQLQSGFLYLYKLGPQIQRHGVGKLPPAPFAEERFSFQV